MRRSLAFLAAFVLLVGLAPTTAANAPIRDALHRTYLVCTFYTGTASGWFAVDAHDSGPDWATITAWTGTDWVFADQNSPVVASGDATSLTATLPLADGAGNPAGTATLVATVQPAGASVEYGKSHAGNQVTQARGQTQPVSLASGTLTIGPLTIAVDPSGCSGDRTDMTVLVTQPHANVNATEGLQGACRASDGQGHDAFVSFAASQPPYFAVDVRVYEGDALLAYGGNAGELVDGHAAIAIDGLTGGDNYYIPGSRGMVDLSLSRTGQTYSYVVVSSNGTERVSGEMLAAVGTATLDGGSAFGVMTFDLTGCSASQWASKTFYNRPNGPKPGGAILVNDLQSGAIALEPGAKDVRATKGASPDFEVGFECDSWPDENGNTVYLNIGYTVWYRIAGTGKPVTVDTAGSDFDTTVGVFTADGSGGWAPLPGGCVEDVPLDPAGVSWQAAVTFPTVAGTWYYVEIGGYPGDYPYGTLKVAVR